MSVFFALFSTIFWMAFLVFGGFTAFAMFAGAIPAMSGLAQVVVAYCLARGWDHLGNL